MLYIALGLLFAGYALGLYGWILVMGYNISFVQLFVGPWPPNAKAGGGPGPPQLIRPNTVIPGSPSPNTTVHPAPNQPGF